MAKSSKSSKPSKPAKPAPKATAKLRAKVRLGSTEPLDAPNAPRRVHDIRSERPSATATTSNRKKSAARQRTSSALESAQITNDDLVEYVAQLLMGGYRKAQIRQAVRELITAADPTADPTRPLDVAKIDILISTAQRNIKRYSTLDAKELKRTAIDILLGGAKDDRVDYRSKAYGVSVLSEVVDLRNVSLEDEDDIAAKSQQAQEEIDSDHVLDRATILKLQAEAQEALAEASNARLKAEAED